LGYNQSQADHSLYIKYFKNSFTELLVYVDDIVVAGISIEEIHHVKKQLDQTFWIKDLGPLFFFFLLYQSFRGYRFSWSKTICYSL
jgi:hypothetical protein